MIMKFWREHLLAVFLLCFFVFLPGVKSSYPAWQSNNVEEGPLSMLEQHSSTDGTMDWKSGSYIFGDVEHREPAPVLVKTQEINQKEGKKRNVVEEDGNSSYKKEQNKRQAEESFVDKFFKRNGLKINVEPSVIEKEEIKTPIPPCKSDTYCDDGSNRVCVKVTGDVRRYGETYEPRCVTRSQMISMIKESTEGNVVLAGSVYKGYYYDCHCDTLSVISDVILEEDDPELEPSVLKDDHESGNELELKDQKSDETEELIVLNEYLEGTVVLYKDPHYTEIYDSFARNSNVFFNHHRIYAALHLGIEKKDCNAYAGSIRAITLIYFNPSECCNINGFFVWNHNIKEECLSCQEFKEVVTIYDINDPDLQESKEYDVMIEEDPFQPCAPKLSWFAINKWGPSTKVKTTITWDVTHTVATSETYGNEIRRTSILEAKKLMSIHQGTHSQKVDQYPEITKYYKIKSYNNVHPAMVLSNYDHDVKKDVINRNTKILSQLERLKDVKYKFMTSSQDITLAITCGIEEGWDETTESCVDFRIHRWLPGMREHKIQLYWLIVFFAFFVAFALVAFVWGLCLHHHHLHRHPHLFENGHERKKRRKYQEYHTTVDV